MEDARRAQSGTGSVYGPFGPWMNHEKQWFVSRLRRWELQAMGPPSPTPDLQCDRLEDGCQDARDQPRKGYRQSPGGTKFSLIVRGETQRRRLRIEPALSFVPLARPPPKGCWLTTAPVGLSLT
jgi:hypothetical protein